MVLTRRGPGSGVRRVGVLALVVGALLTSGIGVGWWWTDLQARQTAHHQADAATRAWVRGSTGLWLPSPDPDDQREHTTGGLAADGVATGVGGSVIAVIRVPRLGADWRMPIQLGTGPQVLREGLGLYTRSPPPGARGNVAVAGHRTTWGAPFKHLNRLRPGDAVTLWSARGRFDYRVIATGVTGPSDTSVIEPAVAGGAAMLTLTTCHPEFSARERLYVHAVLTGSVKPR